MLVRRSRRLLSFLMAALLGLASMGCGSQPAPSGNDRASRPGPEATFEEIVRFVKSRIETGAGAMPSGFVTEQPGRRSQFVVHNKVTSELVPPTAPGEPYRGFVTVTSRSIYSLRRTEQVEDAEDGGGPDPSGEGINMFDDAESDEDEMHVLDGDLVTAAPRTADAPNEPPATVVDRKEDENVSRFELEYENERWVLKTEPDEATERAIKRAFERALAIQP